MDIKRSYESRGVSPHKTDVKLALRNVYKGLVPEAFCKIMPDIFSSSDDYCFLLHADGAGTKSALAYLHYQRHGDPAIFRGIAHDSLVMNLDDLLCVGATGSFVFSNTIGRNAKLIPTAVLHEIIEGYEQLISMLANYGIEIISCGGETADVGDLVRTVIVDSTLATRMRRDDIIDASKVKPDHEIVGLASFGQAIYEQSYNSGIGSNGFTMIRHEVLTGRYKQEFPETFDPSIADLAYTGRFDIDELIPGTDLRLDQALLSPTRTYAPVMLKILAVHGGRISAIFHNTGGGQTKCLGFGHGIRYVKDNLFPLPPVFRFIKDSVGLPMREMARVFNLGHRMEIVCEPSFTSEVLEIAKQFGIDAQVVGRVQPGHERTSLVLFVEGEELEFKPSD